MDSRDFVFSPMLGVKLPISTFCCFCLPSFELRGPGFFEHFGPGRFRLDEICFTNINYSVYGKYNNK